MVGVAESRIQKYVLNHSKGLHAANLLQFVDIFRTF